MSRTFLQLAIGKKRRSILYWRYEMMKHRSIFFAFALAATAAALAAVATPHGLTGLAAVTADLQAPTAKVTFRGTEYLLRPRDGKQYDFTPAGQEDLSTFSDMLSLNLYPAAHDQEALDTITSRVRAIAQGAKATILRTVPASGKQPGDHFFAAVLPTPHGVDFDAIRFVLVDNQASGLFYTHRSYGESAAGKTSAWVTKNAADVEQQLLRFDASRMVSSAEDLHQPVRACSQHRSACRHD